MEMLREALNAIAQLGGLDEEIPPSSRRRDPVKTRPLPPPARTDI